MTLLSLTLSLLLGCVRRSRSPGDEQVRGGACPALKGAREPVAWSPLGDRARALQKKKTTPTPAAPAPLRGPRDRLFREAISGPHTCSSLDVAASSTADGVPRLDAPPPRSFPSFLPAFSPTLPPRRRCRQNGERASARETKREGERERERERQSLELLLKFLTSRCSRTVLS